MLHNFTYILEHFMDWSMQGYEPVDAIGFFIWPIIFSAIIGYIYIKNSSAISGSVAIIIIFTALATTGWVAGVPVLVLFFQVIVALSITGVVLVLLVRRRGT